MKLFMFFISISIIWSTSSVAQNKVPQSTQNTCEVFGATEKELGNRLTKFLMKNETENAKKVIACGADVNFTDGAYSVLMWAGNTDFEFYKELLSYPQLDLNYRGSGGISALQHMLTSAKGTEKARLLIAKGADIFAISNKGMTTLSFAVDSKNIENVKLVVENIIGCVLMSGPDDFCKRFVQFKDMDGKSAIDYAEEFGATDILEYLNNLIL